MRNEKSLWKPQKYRELLQNILYAKKLDNLEEKDNFLEKYNLPMLTQKETENLDRPITSKETELIIKKLPKNKTSSPDGFTAEFYQTFREDIIPILLKVFQKIEEEEYSQTHSMKPASL